MGVRYFETTAPSTPSGSEEFDRILGNSFSDSWRKVLSDRPNSKRLTKVYRRVKSLAMLLKTCSLVTMTTFSVHFRGPTFLAVLYHFVTKLEKPTPRRTSRMITNTV